MFKRKILTIFSMLIITSIFFASNPPVFATTSQGYYDREDESNDTISIADTIRSERVMQGRFSSSSDNDDYYKLGFLPSGTSLYIQLSKVPVNRDYDVYMVDGGGNVVASSLNSGDKGEWIDATVTTSGSYYIQVHRYSGSDTTSYYRLYTQFSGERFNQSFYITYVNDDTWMYNLGRDSTNGVSGLVFLSFGEPEKRNGVYGINDLNGNWASLSRVKTAVDKFIEGYNANPKHSADIGVVVSINNSPSGTSYQLASTTTEYTTHGKEFKSMIDSIVPNGYVSDIHAGIDAEMDYNTPTLTIAWVDGFSQNGNYQRLYNFGDHAGTTSDFSGEQDPIFNNGWKASQIHYVSYGNTPSYVVPQIYVSGMANQWTYQKKWKYLYFSGIMSTNGWGYESNQQSYELFNNKLNEQGLGQTFDNRTWIVLSPPANP